LSILLAVGTCLVSAVSAAQSPTWSVQALPNISGGTTTSVSGINAAGEAVGSVGGGSSICPAGCPAVWSDGTATLLGPVTGATGTLAYSINDSGQVAGTAVIAGSSQAILWNNGSPTLLPSPAPYTQTFAAYLNDSGQVVGQASGQVGGVQEVVATMWNGSTPTVLGLLSGYTSGEAWGINSNGLIVGKICCNGQQSEAVVWHGTTPTLLPVLQPTKGDGGEALAVNNSGVVVGHAVNAQGSDNGATAWANGVLTSLGSLYKGSFATALNDRGIIVGYSATQTKGQHAVIWSRIGAAPIDLNTLISATAAKEITLTQATGINNHCAIVANGVTNKTGASMGFLLTLNEPASCVNGL
jgi:uncharacterized membrane protein